MSKIHMYLKHIWKNREIDLVYGYTNEFGCSQDVETQFDPLFAKMFWTPCDTRRFNKRNVVRLSEVF